MKKSELTISVVLRNRQMDEERVIAKFESEYDAAVFAKNLSQSLVDIITLDVRGSYCETYISGHPKVTNWSSSYHGSVKSTPQAVKLAALVERV